MSDILAKICADKREHIARSKQQRSLVALETAASEATAPRGFAAALTRASENSGLALIAELKKASPSEVFAIVRANDSYQNLDKSRAGWCRSWWRGFLEDQRLIEGLEDKCCRGLRNRCHDYL